MRVETFSIGFGKRLLGFKRGDTDYRLSALPLGGYVKMSGENPMDTRTDDPAEFLNHPRWHRFLIAIAGPAMNILLAVGLLTGVYMVHYEIPVFLDKPAVISWVKADSPAAKAGLESGDRITRIDGVQDPTWEQVYQKVMLSANQPLDITVRRRLAAGRSADERRVQLALERHRVQHGGRERVHAGDHEHPWPRRTLGRGVGGRGDRRPGHDRRRSADHGGRWRRQARTLGHSRKGFRRRPPLAATLPRGP